MSGGDETVTASAKQSTVVPNTTSAEAGGEGDWVDVNTDGSGCKPTKEDPGDCWLPLYPQPNYLGIPLNMKKEAFPRGICSKENEASCWPQPGVRLQAVCLVRAADRTPWLGVFVESTKVLTPSERATAVEGGFIGFAEARWFDADSAPPGSTCI